VSHASRAVWLRYARWLVAGLTFQLAADILETAIAPTWQDIGQLAATRSNPHGPQLLLERDLQEALQRQTAPRTEGAPRPSHTETG
jgi:hypothetical protein